MLKILNIFDTLCYSILNPGVLLHTERLPKEIGCAKCLYYYSQGQRVSPANKKEPKEDKLSWCCR